MNVRRKAPIGIDTSKKSFAIYGIKDGKKCIDQTIDCSKVLDFFANHERCSLILEACGGSHFWARELSKQGHEIKLIAPHKVVPFRKSNKNDRNDAIAIVSAAISPEMQFVAIKDIWQQDIQALHRLRSMHVKTQTAISNEIRGLLFEYGVSVPLGSLKLKLFLENFKSEGLPQISHNLKLSLIEMYDVFLVTLNAIDKIDIELRNVVERYEPCQRIAMVEGIGIISSTALVASCGDPNSFKNGRQFAAWLGLTPKHRQTGGKDSKPILMGITKRGDPYIRSLLVQGAISVASKARIPKEPSGKSSNDNSADDADENLRKDLNNGIPRKKRKYTPRKGSQINFMKSKKKDPRKILWLSRLVEEKGLQKAAVALANRNARVVWSLLKSGKTYNPDHNGFLESA